MKRLSKPIVFKYQDYRRYLSDWLAYMKASQSLSLRGIAKKIGVSPGFFTMVIKNQRHLTDNIYGKLKPLLNFTTEEAEFFGQLRLLADANSPVARRQALANVQGFSAFKKANPNEVEVFQYLRSWCYVAIREMASLPDFSDDPYWIQARLRHRVGVAEIREALAFLLKNGFLSRDDSGKIEKPEKRLECREGVYRTSLAQFHEQMFSLASEAIYSVDKSERNVLGHTLAIPKSKLPELRAIIERTINEVAALEGSGSKATEVYHFGLFSFPLTEVVEGEVEDEG